MRTDDPDYIITFDGGARGNPGEGYGSYELRSRSRGEITRLEFGNKVTNNEAEYRTLIAALRDLIQRITAQGKRPDTYSLAIRGDSQLVIFQITGQWKVRNARIRPLHEETTALLGQFGAVDARWHARTNSVRTLGH
jgi:probable phosphoglycerate mutase